MKWCLLECIHKMSENSISRGQLHTGEAGYNSADLNETFNRGTSEVQVCKGYLALWSTALGWSSEDEPLIRLIYIQDQGAEDELLSIYSTPMQVSSIRAFALSSLLSCQSIFLQ